MPLSLSSPVLIPLTALVSAAIGVLLLDLLDARPRLLAWVSLTSLAVAPALALIVVFSEQGGLVEGMLTGDGTSTLWTIFFCGIGGVSILLEWQSMVAWRDGGHYALLLFAVSGTLVVAQSTHMLSLALGLATLYISLDGLSRLETAWPYLLVHNMGLASLAFGIALLYGATGTFHLDLMADVLHQQLAVGKSNPLGTLGLGFLVGGLIVPLVISLLSRWSPQTHQTTRRPEELYTILLPSTTITALGRLASIWPAHLDIILAILSLCMIGIGYITALRSRTIETTLHSIAIAQAGLVLIVLQDPISASTWGLVLYLFISSSASLTGLWALVAQINSNLGRTTTKTALSHNSIIGLGQRQPWLAAAATLCLLNLAGAPPLAGSVGQLHLYYNIVENGFPWQTWFIIGNAVGIWLLVARWVTAIWRNPTQQQERVDVNPEITILLLVSIAGVLLAGLYAEPVLNWLVRLAAITN
ncbi:MAG: hypothetical protein JXA89_24475 [Anaerolineae bacterium]|nr:hypothetical protein [Anaerolineae bacterium]